MSPTTVGPAPESTAPATPASSSISRISSKSGISGMRYFSWIRSASPAAIRSWSPSTIPAASAPARPALNAASEWGTRRGSSDREYIVANGVSAVTTTAARPRPGSMCRAFGPPSSQAMVKPPRSAAATLSGCPSISAASAWIRVASRRASHSRSASSMPPTIAAAEEPSPSPVGISFSHSTTAASPSLPTSAKTRAIACAT